MAKVVVLVGVPGVGKTSVAKIAESAGWHIINFGDVMFEIAKEKYPVEHRDDMRKVIPIEKYKKLQIEAAERIASMLGNIVVDTHCSIFNGIGYFPGLPMDILLALRPIALVVVEAPPEEIEERRKKDAAIRKREGDPREHQEINRVYAFAYSAISGCAVYFVENRDGKLEEAQQKFLDILNSL